MTPPDTDTEIGSDDLNLDAALDNAEGSADAGLGDVDLDDVLNSGDEGEEGKGVVTEFDFNRPQSISKRFEQNLNNIAENMAKIGTINFTTLLRTNAVIEYEGLKMTSFEMYRAELPNPTCASMITMTPLKGQTIFHLDLNVAFVFLQRLMGGPTEADDNVREFTEIERGVIGSLTVRFAGLFKDGCQKLLKVNPAFNSIENNPNYLNGIPGGDALIILRFMFKLEGVEGPLEIGLPIPAFATVREIFDPEETQEMRSNTELKVDRTQILETLRGTESELIVHLGELDSTLEAVMKMQIGDILHLPQAVDSPLQVLVEGKPVFTGQAGRVNQSRAVKLLEKISEE